MKNKIIIGVVLAVVALIVFNRNKAKAAGNSKVPAIPKPAATSTKPKTVTSPKPKAPTAPKAPTVKSPVFTPMGGFGEYIKKQANLPGPYKSPWAP